MNTSYKISICLLMSIVLWYLPIPENMPIKGWHVAAIFFPVILSFLLRPFPMGAMVIFGLLALMITGTLTTKEAMSGYGDTTVWLVVAAFMIAGGVVKTGFGKRLALILIKLLGKSTLGLGYAFCGAELLLGPVIPSNTARGGGKMVLARTSIPKFIIPQPIQRPNANRIRPTDFI